MNILKKSIVQQNKQILFIVLIGLIKTLQSLVSSTCNSICAGSFN